MTIAKRTKYIQTKVCILRLPLRISLTVFRRPAGFLLDLFKLIPHSSQGNDKVAVWSERVSQHFYVSIDCPVIAVEIKAPDFFQKLFS